MFTLNMHWENVTQIKQINNIEKIPSISLTKKANFISITQ